jgi:hypothetical protein
MSQVAATRKPVADWLTVAAIAAIAISLNVAFHEGVHALTCLVVGGRLQAYSALYSSCDDSILQERIVAGSAPTFNLIAGTLLWVVLRHAERRSSEMRFFLWLLMLMNWFYGAGYFVLSGVANIGDWAVVFDGLQPGWLWRVPLAIAGTALFIVVVGLTLQEFGKMIGGAADEQIRHASRLCLLSYVTSFGVVLLAGFFCPYGLLSLPVTAGACAVLGALSPLLFMMRWFRTGRFRKRAEEPVEIQRKWQWLAAAAVVVFTYAFVLGRTLYF